MLETALKPAKLNISISGSGNYNGKDIPFPQVFINDALSQNILYHSYEAAKTVENLAQLCGVPAYYIEDAIDSLVNRDAMVEVKKGKYQTNFIIINKEVSEQFYKSKDEDIAEGFINRLKEFVEEVMLMDFYKGGKDAEELIYILGIVAMRFLVNMNNPYPPRPHPIRYDGNNWSYHAHVEGCPSKMFGVQELQSGKDKLSYVTYNFVGFEEGEMLTSDEVGICGVILRGGDIDKIDKEKVACLIKNRHIIRGEESGLIVNIPYLPMEQKQQFIDLVEKYFTPIMPTIHERVKEYAEEYKRLFPKHLVEERERICNRLMMRVFSNIMEYAQEQSWIQKPKEGSRCEILIDIYRTVKSR